MAGDELIVQQALTASSLLLAEGYKAEKDLDSSSSLGECSGRGEQGGEGSEGGHISQVWGGEEDPAVHGVPVSLDPVLRLSSLSLFPSTVPAALLLGG